MKMASASQRPSLVFGSTFLNSATRRLSRVTSGRPLIPFIDGLRFIAIIAVLMHHLNGYVIDKCRLSEALARESGIFHLLQGSNCGVQLFFAISGFILALPFARERLEVGTRISLKRYYARRLTRLEPPFLINLSILVVLHIIVLGRSFSEITWPLISTMTYTHNWIYGQLSSINFVTWSLEIEVQFYLLAPFLMRWYFKLTPSRRRTVAILLMGLMVALKSTISVGGATKLRLGLLYTMDHFAAGILVADLFVFQWNESARPHYFWDVAFVVSLTSLFVIQRWAFLHSGMSFLSAFVLASGFHGPVAGRFLSLPGVVITGGMCYSIYLYHFYVISLIGRFTTPILSSDNYLIQLGLQTLLIVPFTLVVCALFFLVFERPFMIWRPFGAAENCRNTEHISRSETLGTIRGLQ